LPFILRKPHFHQPLPGAIQLQQMLDKGFLALHESRQHGRIGRDQSLSNLHRQAYQLRQDPPFLDQYGQALIKLSV
jgi:hypothetical protein